MSIHEKVGDPILERLLAEEKRKEEIRANSFAIPNADAIAFLVEHGPIVEIGAGTGYWAKLIREAGGIAFAYDRDPISTGRNKFSCMKNDYGVVEGGIESVLKHQDCTLFLCWPYMDSMAVEAVKLYEGDKVIYIGEGWGGCTADDDFFEYMKEHFNDQDEAPHIESLDGIRDCMCLYRRNK